MEHMGEASLVFHNAVFGRSPTPVVHFMSCEPERYAQHERAFYVRFREPRKRRGRKAGWAGTWLCPGDDYRYLTLEVGGAVVWVGDRVCYLCQSKASPPGRISAGDGCDEGAATLRSGGEAEAKRRRKEGWKESWAREAGKSVPKG
jgi:hypothetical protein